MSSTERRLDVATICTHCEEAGAAEVYQHLPWHKSCLALWITEYNQYLDSTADFATSYQPAKKPKNEWSRI